MIFHCSGFLSPDTGVSTEMNFISRNTIRLLQAGQSAPSALAGSVIGVSQYGHLPENPVTVSVILP